MIDMRLAEAAVCYVLVATAFALAAVILGAALWGKPTLSFLWSLPARLAPAGLTGRDWATVVLAISAAGIAFVVLSAPGLLLFLRQIMK